MRERVAITGLGAVTGYGLGVEPLWEGLLEGRTTIGPVDAFDATPFDCALASEVKGFSARQLAPKHYRKAVKVMARDIELAVGAAKAAIEDAEIVTKGSNDAAAAAPPTYAPERIGCHIGAGLISCELDELSRALATARSADDRDRVDLHAWGEGAMNNLPPLWLLKYLPNMLACHVTIIHDAQSASNTITCAEASGLLSAGESKRVIERGGADMCFSGGAESKVSPMGFLRLGFAGRLARADASASPTSIARPFDPEAPGQVPAEAGGIVILERVETARERGARMHCELAGFASSQSAFSDDPAQRGGGLALAIERALADAEIGADRIDAILPHAAGFAPLDEEERAALQSVFGSRLGEIPLVTLSPFLGESMAGAGGVALCAAATCLHRQMLPARVHEGRPAAGLDAGPAKARDARLDHMLVCTNALGGQNAAVVLRALRE